MHRPWLVLVPVVIAAIVAPAIVGQVAVNHANDTSYQNALAACERGNAVREVVFANTRNAVRQSIAAGDSPAIIAEFQDNLRTLRAVPGTNQRTGRVDCGAVIERP